MVKRKRDEVNLKRKRDEWDEKSDISTKKRKYYCIYEEYKDYKRKILMYI